MSGAGASFTRLVYPTFGCSHGRWLCAVAFRASGDVGLMTVGLTAGRAHVRGCHGSFLRLLSRFGDKTQRFEVVCPQNGTASLKGLKHLDFSGQIGP